jgi:phage shock protein C
MNNLRSGVFRSRRERRLSGVLGGIARHIDVDPSIVRIGYTAITVFTNVIPGVIVYGILHLVLPIQPNEEEDTDSFFDFRENT